LNLWSVFATGLLSGGASCAAVQGGLLAGAVARHRGADSRRSSASSATEPGPGEALGGHLSGPVSHAEAQQVEGARGGGGVALDLDRSPDHDDTGSVDSLEAAAASLPERKPFTRELADDAAPVGGFLVGKLVSHVAFGAMLGLFGQALQPNFRVRSSMQIGAGALMILMAANLSGLLGKRSFVPSAPKSLQRLVRRSARAETAFGPALLGFLTILVPCGVTLSVEFLVIATGSPITGAAAMGLFVLGTSPLFAVIGYAMRRATTVLRGHLTKLAALAVAVAGVLSINSGLVLRGSAFTLQKVAPGVAANVPVALGGGAASVAAAQSPSASSASSSNTTVPQATVDADGVQIAVISVGHGDPEGGGTPFSPTIVQAKAGIPTKLSVRSGGDLGCASLFVMPSKNVEKSLPLGGETVIDLGTPAAGTSFGFSCGTGMYSGAVQVVAG
jgi:sulfite exporter TauE/SafE